MKPKILKNEAEYQEALAYVETLMDAAPGSPEEDELELFSMLVEQYENEHFPIDLPDPIEAIKFRMEQQGLSRKDLRPYIGSQSKVSEVLNRKRPLSLAMIRALHEGLGIPAEVLLQAPGKELEAPEFQIKDFPFTEMFRRGYFPWFKGSLLEAKASAEELLTDLFSPFSTLQMQRIYCRQSVPTQLKVAVTAPGIAEAQSPYGVDQKQAGMAPVSTPQFKNALIAWHARALSLAEEQRVAQYAHEKITREFIREVAKLSYLSIGSLLVKEMLAKQGIPLVILPHLPHTYLDGACFSTSTGHAVVGLTLRHDRLDNFWFTLIHELVHIHLHLSQENLAYFDNTEGESSSGCGSEEDQANRLTRDLLIPPEAWEREGEKLLFARHDAPVLNFAQEIHVSPAVVAGRIRWETGDYARFNHLIGSRKVRKLFQKSIEDARARSGAR